MKNLEKFAVLGAAAGAATSFILKYVMMALNWIAPNVPDVSIKLANPTLAVNIRESLTGLNGSFGKWLMDNIGLTVPQSMFTNLAISALGGAALFVVGGMIAEQINYFGAKKSAGKVAAVIFAGNAAAAVVFGALALPTELSAQAGVGFVNVLIAFAINAAVLAGLYSMIDKEAGTGLVPK